jgi:hypothetical protein
LPNQKYPKLLSIFVQVVGLVISGRGRRLIPEPKWKAPRNVVVHITRGNVDRRAFVDRDMKTVMSLVFVALGLLCVAVIVLMWPRISWPLLALLLGVLACFGLLALTIVAWLVSVFLRNPHMTDAGPLLDRLRGQLEASQLDGAHLAYRRLRDLADVHSREKLLRTYQLDAAFKLMEWACRGLEPDRALIDELLNDARDLSGNDAPSSQVQSALRLMHFTLMYFARRHPAIADTARAMLFEQVALSPRHQKIYERMVKLK